MIRISLIVAFIAALVVVSSEAKGDVGVVHLADLETRFKNGGDTIFVVNFWATWCKPCVAELPAFDKLSREVHEVKGRAVRFVLVSLDDPNDVETKVAPFVKRLGLHPEIVLLDEAKPHEWIDRVDPEWSGAIPATMFLHQTSRSRWFAEQQFSYEELSETLTSFMKALP